MSLIVDIETRCLPEAVEGFEPKAPSNYKDEAKIEEYKQNAIKQKIEEGAKDPLYGAICAIGFMVPGSSPVFLTGKNTGEEKIMLEGFWELAIATRIIGYHFKGFDLPFIVTRSRMLGVKVPGVYREIERQIDDVMLELLCYQYKKYISLDNAAKRHGVSSALREGQCESAEFWDYFSSGDKGKIANAINHLEADLMETEALAKICNFIQ